MLEDGRESVRLGYVVEWKDLTLELAQLAREQRLTRTYKKRLAAYRRERNASRKRRLRRSALSARWTR